MPVKIIGIIIFLGVFFVVPYLIYRSQNGQKNIIPSQIKINNPKIPVVDKNTNITTQPTTTPPTATGTQNSSEKPGGTAQVTIDNDPELGMMNRLEEPQFPSGCGMGDRSTSREIAWQEPKLVLAREIPNIKESGTFFQVGTLMSGTNAGAKLLINKPCDGFTCDSIKYWWLKNDGLAPIKWDYKTLQPEGIKDLSVPKEINIPGTKAKLKFNHHGIYASCLEQSKLFTDPQFGTIYLSNDKTLAVLPLPDNTAISYDVDLPNFSSITWANGYNKPGEYVTYEPGGCGGFTNPTIYGFKDDLLTGKFRVSGKTNTGLKVYELTDSKDPVLIKTYNNWFGSGSYGYYENLDWKKRPFEEFLQRHPVFFIEDSLGRMVKYQGKEYLPATECS